MAAPDRVQQVGAIRLQWQAASDPGQVRANNEDALIVVPDLGLFGVCDGLGGHAAGEIASAIAAERLKETLESGSGEPEALLREAVEVINRAILDEQEQEPSHRGMGTTLSAVWFSPEGTTRSWIVHIGDSRIYRYRQGQLELVTADHSIVFRLYREGRLTWDEMQHHPRKNIIERSLGVGVSPLPDVFPVDFEPGDIALINTDGLTDTLEESQIESLLGSHNRGAVEALIQAANRAGGIDNITAVWVRIEAVGAASGTAS